MTLFALIAPATARNILLVLIGGCYLGYHLYHVWRWWRKRELKSKVEGEGMNGARVECQQRNLPTGSEGTVGRRVPSPPQSESTVAADPAPVDDCGHAGCVTLPKHKTSTSTPTSPTSLSGEELYAQARAIPHQPVPDGDHDGEYLRLLAQSAAKDYPRALAKLGDYAMRRGWTVEAYYWLWRAKREGMGNLDRMLLQVRNAWASGGFRRERANEYEHFSHEQGTIGYALLCIDARHNANVAKARLAKCAPEFLTGG